ncbi:MAG: type I methionyl aminopeptidase [Candidatus Uhrbacteria bacterium]
MIARDERDRQLLRQGGQHLGRVLQGVVLAAQPGVTIRSLNALAEQLVAEVNGRPSFKGYRPEHSREPFPGALCVSVNSEVVHGRPDRDIELRDGDIVGLDIGMQWPAEGGLYTDTSRTVIVGSVSSKTEQLVRSANDALSAGIAAAAVGSRISDIARAIQEAAEHASFSVVRELVGHGVGGAVHEEPQVPNYWDDQQEDAEIVDGLVLALEPMLTAGAWPVETLKDGWTVVTKDGSLSSHAEHTILITRDGTEVLTRVVV